MFKHLVHIKLLNHLKILMFKCLTFVHVKHVQNQNFRHISIISSATLPLQPLCPLLLHPLVRLPVSWLKVSKYEIILKFRYFWPN